jgi:ribosomal-protein-alanine N-acetyltransferase
METQRYQLWKLLNRKNIKTLNLAINHSAFKQARKPMVQTTFNLRHFQPEDLEQVMEINRICLPENYSTEFFMDLYERYPDTFIVAEEDGEVVGYIMCRIETGLPDFGLLGIAKRGHVISIAVLPKHQREGIGTAIMRAAMQGMRRYKAKECYLEVRVTNEPAVSLYNKLGFETSRVVRSYYADGEDAYIMSVKLKD